MSEQIRVAIDHLGSSVLVGVAVLPYRKKAERERVSKARMSAQALDRPIPSTGISDCRRPRSSVPVCRERSPTEPRTDGVAISSQRRIGGGSL